MSIRNLQPAVLFIFALGACSGDAHEDHPHNPDGSHPESEQEHGETGPNGGHLVEVGDHVAHVEMLHDLATGKLTLYVLGADAKSALPVEKAPEVKLVTEEGPRVLITTREGDTFTVTDAALKGAEPEGRISLEIDGKTYNPDLAHDHH